MLTDKCIKEYSYPVYNCDQNEDNCFVDYVELEIIPDGICFLQQKLFRSFADSDSELCNIESNEYEHIVVCATFLAKINVCKEISVCVTSSNESYKDFLDIHSLLSSADIQFVTETAYSVICKYRNTSKGIHC